MLEDRNIKYPSWVLAALFGYVAFLEASHALALMAAPNASGGWVVELMTCGICAALGTLMLMRPHLWFYAAAAAWSLLAFLANFIMKAKGADAISIERMTFYFIILVSAGVMVAIEGWKWWQAEQAKRPQNPWGNGPWPGQYPGAPGAGGQWGPPPGYAPQQQQQQQQQPPAAPPAPPAAPPAPPAAPPAPPAK